MVVLYIVYGSITCLLQLSYTALMVFLQVSELTFMSITVVLYVSYSSLTCLLRLSYTALTVVLHVSHGVLTSLL